MLNKIEWAREIVRASFSTSSADWLSVLAVAGRQVYPFPSKSGAVAVAVAAGPAVVLYFSVLRTKQFSV
jgi:hypothetical protein